MKNLTITNTELKSFYNGRIKGVKLGYSDQPNPIELQVFFGGTAPDECDGDIEYFKLQGTKKPTITQLEKEVTKILKRWLDKQIDHIDLSIDLGDEWNGKDTEDTIIYIRK